MENRKNAAALLMMGAAIATQSQEHTISNPYAGLTDPLYPKSKKGYKKIELTKKQKKARAASKRARHARKRN